MMNVTIVVAIITNAVALFIGIISLAVNPFIQKLIRQQDIKFQAMDDTCCMLMDFIVNRNFISDNKLNKLMISIQNNILIYGTNNERKLFVCLKQKIYSMLGKSTNTNDSYYVFLLCYLLMIVINHETHKQQIDSDSFLKICFKDYSENYEKIKTVYNNIVKEQNLNKKYLIK